MIAYSRVWFTDFNIQKADQFKTELEYSALSDTDTIKCQYEVNTYKSTSIFHSTTASEFNQSKPSFDNRSAANVFEKN